MDFKVGDLVLYVCDEKLPCVGMVSEVLGDALMLMSIPSYNSFTVPGKCCYHIERVKKLLTK